MAASALSTHPSCNPGPVGSAPVDRGGDKSLTEAKPGASSNQPGPHYMTLLLHLQPSPHFRHRRMRVTCHVSRVVRPRRTHSRAASPKSWSPLPLSLPPPLNASPAKHRKRWLLAWRRCAKARQRAVTRGIAPYNEQDGVLPSHSRACCAAPEHAVGCVRDAKGRIAAVSAPWQRLLTSKPAELASSQPQLARRHILS